MILKVQIVRYVDDHFPGWVECEFFDAENYHHTIMEKVPVVSEEWFGPDSGYPQEGGLRCEILGRWRDVDGRDLVRITIEEPDHVETTEGVTEFVVLSSQVISAEATISQLEKQVAKYEDKAQIEPKRASALLHNAKICRERIVNLRNGHWKS
jgi:hypothetical protein